MNSDHYIKKVREQRDKARADAKRMREELARIGRIGDSVESRIARAALDPERDK